MTYTDDDFGEPGIFEGSFEIDMEVVLEETKTKTTSNRSEQREKINIREMIKHNHTTHTTHHNIQ